MIEKIMQKSSWFLVSAVLMYFIQLSMMIELLSKGV